MIRVRPRALRMRARRRRSRFRSVGSPWPSGTGRRPRRERAARRFQARASLNGSQARAARAPPAQSAASQWMQGQVRSSSCGRTRRCPCPDRLRAPTRSRGRAGRAQRFGQPCRQRLGGAARIQDLRAGNERKHRDQKRDREPPSDATRLPDPRPVHPTRVLAAGLPDPADRSAGTTSGRPACWESRSDCSVEGDRDGPPTPREDFFDRREPQVDNGSLDSRAGIGRDAAAGFCEICVSLTNLRSWTFMFSGRCEKQAALES